MNILILNWRDPKHPHAGGAEISLLEHAKYWRQKGASITWFSSEFKGSLREEEIDKIKIIRKGSYYTVFFWVFYFYFRGWLKTPGIIIDSFHFIPFFTPIYVRRAKIVGLINEIAGSLWFANARYPVALVGYIFEPFFFKFYRKVNFITGSNSAKKDLVKVGIDEDKISVIHHGVSVPKIKKTAKEETPTILFLGRISKDKGIKDAIKAFEVIKKKINIRMWIAGKEEVNGMIRSLIKDNADIKYFGYVTEEEKFNLLTRSWVLVHPSRKEGWGMTVIEAASQGTPTVGYNVAGLSDSIKDKQTGVLTNPDFFSLGKAVMDVISNKKLYNSLSKEAIIWSKEFDWKESGEQSFNLLKRIHEQNVKN